LNTLHSLPVTNAAARSAVSGLHIVANLSVPHVVKLVDYHFFKDFIETQIRDFQLTKVGEAYHNFPGGGYTGVICLTESHLSIHTWPEQQYATFDVFLSNYLKDNRATTHGLYEAVRNYFQADILFEQIINR